MYRYVALRENPRVFAKISLGTKVPPRRRQYDPPWSATIGLGDRVFYEVDSLGRLLGTLGKHEAH